MRRFLKRLLLTLAIFAGLAVGAYFYAQWQGERELRAVIAELDAKGPWRWEDLYAPRSLVDEENDLRPLILKIHRQAGPESSKSVTDVFDLAPNLALHGDDVEAYSETMTKLDDPLRLARGIARMPKGRLPLVWKDSEPSADFDSLERTRSANLVLTCGAAWFAHQGDLDAASECCLAIAQLAAALQEEPALLVLLLRIGTEHVMCSTLERTLAQGQPSPASLLRVQKKLTELDHDRAARHAIEGERATVNRSFELLHAGKLGRSDFPRYARPTSGSSTVVESMKSSWNYLVDSTTISEAHARCLRHLSELLESLDVPREKQLTRQHELDRAAEAQSGYTRTFIHPCARLVAAHRKQAHVACAIVALAAERYRQELGQWPKSAADLTPRWLDSVPRDPFADQPLSFRRTVDGIVAYSVGPDGGLRGEYRDRRIPTTAESYEFRLWDVAQRRKPAPPKL